MSRAHAYLLTLALGCVFFALCGAYPSGIANGPLWATRAAYGTQDNGSLHVTSGTTTLPGDRYYLNLTVDVSTTLATANFRVTADRCIINGTVSVVGGAGGTLTAGTSIATGSLSGGTAGGAGCQNTSGGCNGTNGTAGGTGFFGGIGGAGGAVTGVTAGNGGTLTTPGAGGSQPRYDPWSLVGITVASTLTVSPVVGGTGGGGGPQTGAGFSGGGGGGGGGGGVIAMACRSLEGSGSITAKGGQGGDGSMGNAGGGGGGGGGAILLNVGDTSLWSGSTDVTGGAGGAGVGTGATGSVGATGVLVTVRS